MLENHATSKNRRMESQLIKKFYRYCGRKLVDLIKNIPLLTPNHVSFFSLFTAFISSLLFLKSEWLLNVIAVLLIQFSIILDYADGSLAREKKMHSLFGRWLDTQIDRLADFFIFTGVSFGLYFSGLKFALIIGFFAMSIRLLISFLHYSTRLIIPSGYNLIEQAVEKTNFTKSLVFSRPNIHLIIFLFTLINKLYSGFILLTIYELFFYFFSFFYFIKKIRRIENSLK